MPKFQAPILAFLLLGFATATADAEDVTSSTPRAEARPLFSVEGWWEGLVEPRQATGEISPDAAGRVERESGQKKKKAVKDPDGWTSGYDHGFFIKKNDRTFKLKVTGQVQVRGSYNVRQRPTGDHTRSEFELRRVKLKAAGYIFGPELEYSVQGSYRSDTNAVKLESAYVRAELGDELKWKIGRYRPPLLREEDVSSKRQLLVERSLVARTFSVKRSIGTSLHFKNDVIRAHGGFFQRSDDLLESEAWFVTGRAEWLVTGKWKRLSDFTSFPGNKLTIALGGGVYYEYEDRNDAVTPDSTLFRWTADVSVELGGANVFAALVGNRLDVENQPTRDQYGLVVQGGVFLSDGLELVARYETADSDGLSEDLELITVGFNSYFDKHRLKLSVDVGYGPNEVGTFWRVSGTDWHTDLPGEDGQVVVRAQLQWLF